MKKIGKGLTEKRLRLLRSLDAHLRWLRVAATLGPWTPPVREPHAERPYNPPRYRSLPEYVYPVERPELARPCPGPEALSETEVAPYRRAGRQEATARALGFIASFAPSCLTPAAGPGNAHVSGSGARYSQGCGACHIAAPDIISYPP